MVGFSTVSATFMVIVAKTLGFMDRWTMFFLSALIITFVTSAIVCRLYPLRKIKNSYYNEINNADNEKRGNKGLLKTAVNEALKTAEKAPQIHRSLLKNFKDGMLIIFRLAPLMVSIATIAFLLVYNTQLFDFLGYIFYPILKLMQVPDTMLVSKAAALAAAEMFTPAAIVSSVGASELARYVTGMISISSIIFFAGPISVILATEVQISIKDLLLVFLERVYIIIILAAIAGHILL